MLLQEKIRATQNRYHKRPDNSRFENALGDQVYVSPKIY